MDRRRPPTAGSGMFATSTGAFTRTTEAFARTTGAGVTTGLLLGSTLVPVDDAAPISIIGRETRGRSKVDRLKARPQMKAR